MQNDYINFTSSNNNTNMSLNPNTNKKNVNKLTKIFLIIIIVVFIFTILYFCFFRNIKEKTTKEFNIYDSESFFINDRNGKYALFNKDGKQLTDFIFTEVGYFINGSTYVKKDDLLGIIKENGKMIADFGDYRYIFSRAGVYNVVKEDGQGYLIDGDGKILYDMENMDFNSFGVDTYSILEDNGNKFYRVLGYDGKVITNIPMSSNSKPNINENYNYISIFYNNKNYIIDVVSKKEIIEFDSEVQYCITFAKNDEQLIVMKSCDYEINKQDKTYYKIIKKGKLYNLNDKCEEIYYSDSLICQNDNKEHLLDSNLNVGITIRGKAYVDNNTYAMEKDGSFSGVDFYINGKFLKNVECRSLESREYVQNGLYRLKTYYSKKCGTDYITYEYYNSNGENVFNKSFKKAEKFDINNLAKVSDDGINIYLINTKGNKVSQEYSKISVNNDYYIVTKNNLTGIIDKYGKVIVDCLYKSIRIDKKYAILEDSNSKYIVFDLEKKSEIIKTDNRPYLSKQYIEVSIDEKKQYYTYTGKMFYEK